jgi:serine/threonine protein kinase/formylglycine-generating enzyme required for sulfatase activity
MSESESKSGLVMELAEEFLDRYRKGERPPLKEYIDRHPELAAEIKEVFPAMAMMENIAVADSSSEGDESEKKAGTHAEVALRQLGDYRIIREIGHGGMGVVYEAEQVSLGRHVALKVLPSQALADAKHKRRFEREAKAAAKLHHTNIVPVFGVGEHEGMPYYVMQFIQGLGLDVVLHELNHMKPWATHTPTGLPTAGEIRISRRSVAAADVARSLLTGAFQLTADSDQEAEAPEQPAVAVRGSPDPAQDGTEGLRGLAGDSRSGVPAGSGDPRLAPAAGAEAGVADTSATGTSGLSESFTVSSSSINLPGSGTTTGSKSVGKKQSYWQSVAHIGRQVADALDYAHKQGILHRDVKPSNLLLDLRGTVWVTDFGLAKVAGPGGENLTHTGDVLGTLRYMPPEAFEGKSDARGDVYSLGLTMYELLALRPAFDEKDRNKLIKHVTTGEPAQLHKVKREAPRDLVTIIHKAIDRDPGRRYATAEDMASDLQRFLDDEPILARRQTQLERYWRWARHNPGMAVLGSVLTAVLVIATLASLIVAGRMSALADDAKRQEGIANQQREIAEEKAKEAKAYGLVQLALNVDTPKLPPIIEKLTEYRQWTDPMLREVSDRSPHKLHASLALLPADPGQVDYLYGRLLEAEPRDVLPVIRDALAPYKDRLLDKLWAVVEKPELGKESQRLRAAAALAKYDPESERWTNRQAETFVFLSTLQEKNVRVLGSNSFRKDGFINGQQPLPLPVVVDGAQSPHSLFTHPAPRTFASVSYDLDRPYAQFLAKVCIPAVLVLQGHPGSPLTFEIIGNGKSIWKSKPLTKKGDIQDCQIGLAGIKQLELRVNCAESNNTAWAVWLEPRLTHEQKVHGSVVEDLVALPAAQLTSWKDLLRPVRHKLLTPLSGVYRSIDSSAAERSLATSMLADYAADQPRLLADLLLDADEKQFAVIFPKLKEHGERGVPLLTSEFSKEMPTPPVTSDWTVRFYKWHDVDKDHPANWEAVLKSPTLDELRMPRLYLVGDQIQKPAPPTPRVPLDFFAAVATSEVTLGEGAYTIRTTADDGVRVWLDNNLVIDDWVWGPPRTKSAAIVNKPGRHLIKVEFFQAAGGYTLDVDLTIFVPDPEKLAKRQANAAVALLRMDQPERVWPLLKHSYDPRGRSYLIHALSPRGADPKAIVKQVNRESDVKIRRALLLSLGEFGEKVSPDERKAFLPKLREMYRAAPDAGLHAASEWLLRQWKEEAWLKETNQAWAVDKQQQAKRLEQIEQELKKETGKDEARWYVNGQGQTLVVIPGPVEFWMGSPPTEEGRGGPVSRFDELRHWRRIGRSFAIASKEVTVEQFLRRKDHPISRQHAPSDDCPVNMVSWYDAAAYCNWLSEQEGIPKDQWCYQPNAQGQYGPGMKLAANYLQRTGYRLPSEAEWEFACRAGAVTRYSFGESEELLPRYAWYEKNWQGKLRPVGSLKPNDLGLFDMHGNDWEWCQEEYKSYLPGEDGKATEDNEDSADIDNGRWRILRGGVFNPMGYERSAARAGNSPVAQIWWNGLRPVRTLPFSSFDRYAAARAAVLAASGQNKDKPRLDDAAKAKRLQALDWLKAELANWSEVQPPRLFLARNLWQWQQESDLAGIRDQAALAKLPPEEQKAFKQFWADVAKSSQPANNPERLDFARVAVRIATGQAAAGRFDKAKLRQQALDWLKAARTATFGRAGKAQIIAAAAPLPGLLEKLAESAPNDALFQAELTRHFAEQGNYPLANTAHTKARALLEAQLAKEPDNAAIAGDLADVLLIDTSWTVLKPTEAKSELGATLSLLPDNSILASGANPPKDRYRVVLTVPKDIDLAAVRLETLTHPSLPADGPGRYPGRPGSGQYMGTFAQESWTVTATAPNGKDPITLEFDKAWADVGRVFPITSKGHWNVHDGGEGRNCTATWSLPKAVFLVAGTALTFEMKFSGAGPENLGRFRLSASSDRAAIDRAEKTIAALKIGDPWHKLAVAYAENGSKDAALRYFGKALQRADDRAGKARIIAEAARLQGMVEKLAKSAPNDGPFQAELARYYAEHGNSQLADAARTKARAVYEAKLAKEPDNAAIAGELADLLLKDSPAKWTVLKPAEMNSEGGATLTMLEDNSILVSGPNPNQVVYTLAFRDLPARIQQLRLEVLPHESLPHNGPGRYPPHGGFNLTTIKVQLGPAVNESEARNLKLARAYADFSQTDYSVDGAIDDGNDNTGWAIFPETGKSHFALFALAEPVTETEGKVLRVTLEFKSPHRQHSLGRFRLSVSPDAAAIDREQNRLAALKLTDPWAKLAGAYQVLGDQRALDALLKQHPPAAIAVGDLCAARQHWERSITFYRQAIAEQTNDVALLTKLATAYQSAGRTKEALPYFARASAADPKDTALSVKVAALQAWFGQDKELAATRQRILAFAKDTNDAGTAEKAAKACSIRASTPKAELYAALALARKGVELDRGSPWRDWKLLALGMAEYRNGNYAAANEALLAAVKAIRPSPNNPSSTYFVTGASVFYRAMSLFRQGKKDEARKLAIEAAAKMKPLPADENNPLAGDADQDDVILWLAYTEARTLLKIELSWVELLEEARLDQVKTLGANDPATLATTLKLAGACVAVGNWKNAAAHYSQLNERNAKADSIAWMGPPILWAYAGETGWHRESCQKMFERFQKSAVPDDNERCLKVMLLLEPDPGLPEDAVKKLHASMDKAVSQQRAWFLVTQALLECRKGRYAEARKAIDEALALEKASPLREIKVQALAVRALVYAKQKDVAKARKALDQAKQLMSGELKMKWKPDGQLDGSTILNGATVEQEKLIAEIIRREAEKLVQSEK